MLFETGQRVLLYTKTFGEVVVESADFGLLVEGVLPARGNLCSKKADFIP